MSNYYKAKVRLEGSRLTFEINEEMEYMNAKEFAEKSVKSWLECHGDDVMVEDSILVKYSDQIFEMSRESLRSLNSKNQN
ncbi:hypothetical protein [Bacteriovorax sp. Seq25_V]|uniref:hypothetical protein n=1 Tax=Bacteriovorax sp. Seq25_V TaxID=1201288 RepID=UPI000389EAA1|nr:hypothetical protein [Bacteriovorax sp. Seq25_V]EQC43976.1 hypothetical protein M900_1478 [Bacteriovorax sp. Seq25_V]